MHKQGLNKIPPNPLIGLPALASFRNIIVYMFLIGTLLAIVVGHRSFIRERKSGTMQLLLTRPISLSDLLLGKIVGICLILLSVIGVTAIVSLVSSFFLPFQHLGASDIERLLLFYLLSFFYLLLFALVGLFFAIRVKSESLALFIPVCIWVGVTFVLPELVSGQTPTALLNPVTMAESAAQGSFFSLMRLIFNPISMGWRYVSLASRLLNTSLQNIRPLTEILLADKSDLIVTALMIVSIYMLCFWALQRYSPQNDTVGE